VTDDVDDREQKLLEQLVVSPIAEVVGVVGPRPVALSRWPADDHWTLSFNLDRWRIANGEISTTPLGVRRKIEAGEKDQWRALLARYAVLRIRARVVANSVFGSPQALLEEIIGRDESDAELNEHAKKLQQPVTHEDSVFGVLRLNRGHNWYVGQATWNGTPIELKISVESDHEMATALETAHRLCQDQAGWNARLLDCAVAKLLPLKNSTWLDDDEAEPTAEQFCRQMTLKSVTVRADGSFDFWFDDGDLFWGHAISVSGNLKDGPSKADISG
jgi:hypothetical protein